MTGRRAAIALSLLCALLFSAFAVQSASALGTTAYTCASGTTGTGVGPQEFSDAHCDNATTVGNVQFVHKEISGTILTSTHIHVSNEATASLTSAATPAVMVIHNFHGFSELKITCTEVTAIGATGRTWLRNFETAGTMQIEGGVELSYHSGGGGNCTVSGVSNCTTVTVSPVEGKVISVEPAPGEMGLKVEPAFGENFTQITLNGTCAIAGTAFPVKGTVTATAPSGPNGGGATAVVTPAMSNLTLGGVAATLSQTTTARMQTVGLLGNAIALTTK